jgi:hypothetical protein
MSILKSVCGLIEEGKKIPQYAALTTGFLFLIPPNLHLKIK